MNYPYSGMLSLMLVGERNFPSSYLYPLPTQPGFGVYFFLSYLRSKTLYIFAHGFPLSKKSKASLAICQGFLENLPTSQEVREIASKFAGVESLKEAIATRSLRETEQLQLLLSSA
jgi:hypothetical protein